MRIKYFCDNTYFKLRKEKSIAIWLERVIWQEGYRLEYLHFIFCSDTILHHINVHHLNHDTWTDVITFDYRNLPKRIQGEVYISIDRIRENAKLYQHPLQVELYTVMLHGLLHLLGYDDHSPGDIARMRAQEQHYLGQLLGTIGPALAPKP